MGPASPAPAGGNRIRPFLALVALLAAPLVVAEGTVCSLADPGHVDCVPFETLFFGTWDYDEPYGGYVVTDVEAWNAMWEMRVNSHRWPPEPVPVVDFERSFLAIHVGVPGHMPGTTTQIEEIVSSSPGEYAIAYASTLNPGFDVEWMGAPVHAVIVERAAGDPSSVTWLGWQTTPDGRPIL